MNTVASYPILSITCGSPAASSSTSTGSPASSFMSLSSPVISSLSSLNSSNSISSLSFDPFENIQTMAFEACATEIDAACETLAISSDPFNWSVKDVHSWILWQIQQYQLPSSIRLEFFNMNGIELCSLNEQDFKLRAPSSGETLYALLDIWRLACIVDSSSNPSNGHNHNSNGHHIKSSPSKMIMGHHGDHHIHNPHHHNTHNTTLDLLLDEMNNSDEDGYEVCSPGSISSSHSLSPASVSTGSPSPSSPSSCSVVSTTGNSTGPKSGSGGGGSHIHLWQFLKELLAQPQAYGSCIRWLDRQRGIFKIEDSVRVARLWGKRKNRPAMNYDKLSRSIRQYYKKGIMKKTERSQRLVYQFCHPYAL